MSFFGIPMRNGLSLGLGTVASLTNGPGFLPDELFYGGTVQGAWYDPSDLTTLFQDAAGTTPVTAVEQAVGLMLDKSKGLVLGPELVTNGDFSGGSTGWGLAGGVWSVSGGVASTVGGSGGGLTQNISLTAGRAYVVTLDISGWSANTIVAQFTGGSTASGGVGPLGNGRYYTIIFANSGNTTLSITKNSTATALSVDNISVRELPGNHAYQSTSASRPTLRARYNLLTRSEEFDNAVWTKPNSTVTANATIAPDGTTTAETFTRGATTGSESMARQTTTQSNATTYILSVYAKGGSAGALVYLRNPAIDSALPSGAVTFALDGTNTITAGSTYTGKASITDVGNGWYRCSIFGTTLNPIVNNIVDIGCSTNAGQVTGAAGAFIYLWGAQLVPTAVFPSNIYQRIGAATDYATGAAFPPYLFFDGIDDSMLTNSVDFATVTSDGQARRNLLTNPTQFDAAGWTATDVTVTANATIAPDSTTTADLITTTNTSDTLQQLVSVVSGTTYTFSGYVKDSTAGSVFLVSFANTSIPYIEVNLSNGNITYFGGATIATATNVGNGWWRISLTTTANQTASVVFRFASASANAVSAYFLWGAQLETGSTATAFQNIGTDQMNVAAGVTKSSDAATGMILESSSAYFSSAGTFALYVPAGASYVYGNRGTSQVDVTASGFASPITNVLTGAASISPASETVRVNGAVAASATSSLGTGNFGNYPLFIGRRNNASLPFNGNIYGLVIVGTRLSAGQISSTESWLAAKTPLGTL